jgi:hypothetical protein
MFNEKGVKFVLMNHWGQNLSELLASVLPLSIMPHCDRDSSGEPIRAIKGLIRIATHSFPFKKALFCRTKLLKIHSSSFSQRGGQRFDPAQLHQSI